MSADRTVIDFVNKALHSQFRVLDGRPIYRVVFSADLVEVRVGTFTDWYGHILIRQEHKACRRIKKYWYYDKPCWVLEKLVFIRGNQALKEITEELVEAKNGSYEPLYAFVDGEGNPLPFNERVVWKVLDMLHNPRQRTPSDVQADEFLAEEEEVKYFENEIGKNERPELFVFENSTFVSTRQLEFRKKNTYIEKDSQVTIGE